VESINTQGTRGYVTHSIGRGCGVGVERERKMEKKD